MILWPPYILYRRCGHVTEFVFQVSCGALYSKWRSLHSTQFGYRRSVLALPWIMCMCMLCILYNIYMIV